MLTLQQFIDGRFIDPVSGRWFDKIDPAIGRVVAQVPDGDGRDVDAAVEAAARAFPRWSRTPAAERARLLLSIADRIDANLDRLALAESIDGGKAPSAVADGGDSARGVQLPLLRRGRPAVPLRGVPHRRARPSTTRCASRAASAGLLSPWNLPLYLFTWKVAPALATGNTVVAKPSELTPTTAHLLAEICQEVGPAAGRASTSSTATATRSAPRWSPIPAVPTISFTGGTAVGAEIAEGGGAAVQEADPGTGRQEPQHHLRRRRPGRRAADEPARRVRQPGRNLPVRLAHLRRGDRFIRISSRHSRRQARRLKVGDPLEPASTRGADLAAAIWTGCRPTSSWRRKRAAGCCAAAASPKSGRRALQGRGLPGADGDRRSGRGLPRQSGGDLRPGRDDHAVPHGGRGGRATPTPRRSACRRRCGRATWAGRIASRSSWSAARCG